MLKTKIRLSFNWFNKLSLVNRITVLYGVIFSFIFILTSVFYMFNANYFYTTISKQELEEAVTRIVDYIEKGGEITADVMRELNPNNDIEVVISNIRSGEPMQFLQIPRMQTMIVNVNQQLPEVKDKGRAAFQMATVNELRYMVHPQFATYDGESYMVTAYRKYAKEIRILRSFAMVFCGVNVVGIFVVFLIGHYISKSLLKPVTNVIATAERISIEDLSQRISVKGPDDEIKKMAVAFNDMIERLEISFNKQNQFISDASHELRTPMSVIQGYANLIDRWGKSDEVILQEAIDSIKSETEHMNELVKKLIFLAKDEDNKRLIHKKPLFLNYVASEIIREFNVLDISSNISLEEEADVYINGDYNFIKQMLWGFVENSVKYTLRHDGKIIIRIFEQNGFGCVSVKDNGIGIAEEDIPFVFERFYRSDKSRNKEIPGTGLGLSIAKWIIKQHNGKVEVRSQINNGTEITVSFDLVEERDVT